MARLLAETAVVCLLCLLSPGDAGAQEGGPNTVTVSMGRSREDTFNDPTEIVHAIGADYMRQVKGRWELGVQFDLDFDRDGSGADAFLITPVLAFNITPRWPVFAGGGVAFEPDDHTTVFGRIGTEYMFPIGHKGLFIALGTFLDISDDATPSVMLALGRTF
jgi:hypothetical protein